MKAFLMFPDRDFQLQQPLVWNGDDLVQDLELNTLFTAMAGKDEFLLSAARTALLAEVQNDIDTILYRQEVMQDCLRNAEIVKELYGLAVETIERSKKEWWGISSHFASSMLYSSVDLLEVSLNTFRRLRGIAEQVVGRFASRGFERLFGAFREELDDNYLARVQTHLTELKFRKGVLVSAELGRSNEGTDYLLRRSPEGERNWFRRIFGFTDRRYSFRLADRDESGSRILSEMRQQGISRAAVATAESADHVLGFFRCLRTELGFYIGCMNLHARLVAKQEPICFPTPLAGGTRKYGFAGLYDVCLALHLDQRVVGNSANADGMSLVVITGANQGGKSSFLRSVGLAQMMMQCGMFVGAETFRAELSKGLVTHYKREEDAKMKSGKFDEELARLSESVNHLKPNAMVLFNESFAATNEREGSEIAKQIVRGLVEKQIKIFFVTHLYEFAHEFFVSQRGDAMFLRAERLGDGARTFRLLEGEPFETGHGEDLYHQIFGSDSRGDVDLSNSGNRGDGETGLPETTVQA
jgi:DNA mismatch repair ATPase MutS